MSEGMSMMKGWSWALAGAAALSMVGASQAAPRRITAAVSAKVVTADAYPQLRASFPGGVTGRPDVVYSAINGYRPMTLDLYVPPKAGGPKPLVVYVHGGGWENGTARNAGAYTDFPVVLAELAARGYVVASVNYRLSGEARAPAASQDVSAAIRFLRAHAAQYGIDASRVAIWGGSAGGQLAGLAATDCHPNSGPGESDCVQAAAIWYGVFDFTALAPPPGARPQGARSGGPVAAYLGCAPEACPDVARAQSPIAHVDAHSPPMLIIYGSDDHTVPPDQSRAMAAKLKSAGVRTEVMEIPGVGHSFIGKTPEATRAASLKALRATFAFFDATVGARR